jgi:hypothetical protein
MEHTIAQPELTPNAANAPMRNLSATMAAAVAGTVGRAIGSRVGAYAQERIKRLRENTS